FAVFGSDLAREHTVELGFGLPLLPGTVHSLVDPTHTWETRHGRPARTCVVCSPLPYWVVRIRVSVPGFRRSAPRRRGNPGGGPDVCSSAFLCIRLSPYIHVAGKPFRSNHLRYDYRYGPRSIRRRGARCEDHGNQRGDSRR